MFLPTTYKFPLGSVQSPSDAFLWGLWSLSQHQTNFTCSGLADSMVAACLHQPLLSGRFITLGTAPQQPSGRERSLGAIPPLCFSPQERKKKINKQSKHNPHKKEKKIHQSVDWICSRFSEFSRWNAVMSALSQAARPIGIWELRVWSGRSLASRGSVWPGIALGALVLPWYRAAVLESSQTFGIMFMNCTF